MPRREWNPKSFFRQISPALLTALFERPHLPFCLDGVGQLHEQAYRVWRSASEEQRQQAERELLPLNDLSAPHARPYLEELAARVWAGEEALRFIGDWCVHDLAIRLLLADRERFAEMHENYAVDPSEPLLEFRGRYPATPEATGDRKARLTQALATCLRASSASARVAVEDFADDSKLVMHLFYEGELSAFHQLAEGGTVQPRWARQVHRVVLVFYFDTSTLLVGGVRRLEAEKLSALFADLYLGDESYFECVDHRPRFCFDPLRDPQFHFPTMPADQVEIVSLSRVVARHSHQAVRRVVVDLESKVPLEVAHRALAEHGVQMATAIIDAVRLEVRFQGKGRARIRTVHLAQPNTSTLNDTKRDRVIRGYLREWGIYADVRHTVASSTVETASRRSEPSKPC